MTDVERDPERIYLEPPPYSPEGRLWCAVDVWPLEGDGPSGVEYVRADLVRRELEAPGEDEALWREYEEAREEFEKSAKLYQFAGDSESLSDLVRDRARLDAAVRALAAAPPAYPGDSWLEDADAAYQIALAADALQNEELRQGIDLDALSNYLNELAGRLESARAAAPREREEA